MRILFIGNSHTYFNSMPDMVAQRFRDAGVDCDVAMIAHGRWFLQRHAQEPDVKFNILYGNYDYVVLQEHGQPFAAEERYFPAVRKINKLIQKAGARPVIYMTWAKKGCEENQAAMNAAGRAIAAEIGAVLAPVGEYWWDYMREHPDKDLYYVDGGHASVHGSALAADVIFKSILEDAKANGKI